MPKLTFIALHDDEVLIIKEALKQTQQTEKVQHILERLEKKANGR